MGMIGEPYSHSMMKWDVHCPHCDCPIDSTPRVKIYKRLLLMCRKGREKEENIVEKLKRKIEVLKSRNTRLEGELATLESNALKRIEELQDQLNQGKAEIIVIEQGKLTCKCGEKERNGNQPERSRGDE